MKTIVRKLRALIALITVAVLVGGTDLALAQSTEGYGADGEAWRPKENFWWLFAAYAVIWVALFAYVARMASRQQELEREMQRLDRKQNG